MTAPRACPVCGQPAYRQRIRADGSPLFDIGGGPLAPVCSPRCEQMADERFEREHLRLERAGIQTESNSRREQQPRSNANN